MPRRKMIERVTSTVPDDGTVPAYRYSPGDRHTYVWDGGAYATVYRHELHAETGQLLILATGDLIDMTGCPRTLTGFAARVDEWRQAH